MLSAKSLQCPKSTHHKCVFVPLQRVDNCSIPSACLVLLAAEDLWGKYHLCKSQRKHIHLIFTADDILLLTRERVRIITVHWFMWFIDSMTNYLETMIIFPLIHVEVIFTTQDICRDTHLAIPKIHDSIYLVILAITQWKGTLQCHASSESWCPSVFLYMTSWCHVNNVFSNAMPDKSG